MTSRNSSFNLGDLIKHTVKRNAWAIALSILIFMCTLPLSVATIIENKRKYSHEDEAEYSERISQAVADCFGLDNVSVIMVMIAIAVIVAVALFRYLHIRKQVDFYHSIPVKRQTLFASLFISGFIIVIPAYFLGLGVAGAIASVNGYAFATMATLQAILTNIIFFALIYAITVLCVIACGNTIVSLLLTGWSMFVFSGIYLILVYLKGMFFATYSPNQAEAELCIYLSPIVKYMSLSPAVTGRIENAELVKTLAVALGLFVVVTIIASLVFRIRASEKAGSAIAFDKLKAPVKFVCTGVMATFIAIFFIEIGSENWLVFGLLVGGILTHMLMEMIYSLDFKAGIKNLKSLLIFAILFGAFIGCFKMDILGFDKYIPETNEVQSVDISAYGSLDVNLDYCNYSGEFANLSDGKIIQNVLDVAQIGVNSLDSNSENEKKGYIQIKYVLNNGKEVRRKYEIPLEICEENDVDSKLREILYSAEYQQKFNEVFNVDQLLQSTTYKNEQLEMDDLCLTIDTLKSYSDSTVYYSYIKDTAHINEILNSLKNESLSVSQEKVASSVPTVRIKLEYLSDYYTFGTNYITVFPFYTETIALIEKYSDAETVKLTSDDIDRIVVSSYVTSEDVEIFVEAENAILASTYDTASGSAYYTITDKTEIDMFLENATTSVFFNYFSGEMAQLTENEDIEVEIRAFSNDGSDFRLAYSEDNVPTEVIGKYILK